MIDLVDIKLRIWHKPFGTVRLLKREDGTDGITKCLTKNVSLYDDGAFVKVTSLNKGAQIGIRCCPAKVLQGHNIFGTNNVIRLANKLIEYVLLALEIKAGKEQINAWEMGEFEIQALDITHSFSVDSHLLVSRLLTHILRTTSMKLRPAAIYPGIGVRMLAPHRQADWLFYDKRLEFDDKRYKEEKYLYALVGDHPNYEELVNLLLQTATNNVRAELKLGKDYLKNNKLNVGSAWSREKVKEIYFQELHLLRLGSVPSIEYAKALLDRLTDPKLRQTFIGWIHGENLGTYGSRQTLRGRRDAILKAINIDIMQDVMPLEAPPLNVEDTFDAANVLPDFPEWGNQFPAVSYKGQEILDIRKKSR